MTHGFNLMLISSFLLFGGSAFSQDAVPENWGCEADHYEDGVCDCGCVVPDRDCPEGKFDVCERSGCAEGQVPWEHRPTSCMRSACGDGWVDERLGESCDDGEALDSGGCNGDCSSVNPGWTCGANAEQCSEEVIRDSEDTGVVTADADLTNDSFPDMGSQDIEQSDAGQPESTQEDAGTVSVAPFQGEDAQQADGCTFQSTPQHRLPIFLMSFVGVFLLRARRDSRS